MSPWPTLRRGHPATAAWAGAEVRHGVVRLVVGVGVALVAVVAPITAAAVLITGVIK